MEKETSTEDKWIRRQVQLALAANRTPGYHYPGYLPGCHWPRIGEDDLDAVMPEVVPGSGFRVPGCQREQQLALFELGTLNSEL